MNKGTYRSVELNQELNKESRNKLINLQLTDFDRGATTIQWGKNSVFNKRPETTGYPHAEE